MAVHTWANDERLYAADLNSSFASVNASEGARVGRSAAKSLTTAVTTTIDFDTEIVDHGGFHSNVTNNTRLTIPRTGWYLFGGTISFASNATGFRGAILIGNGATTLAQEIRPAVATSFSTVVGISTARYMTTADYIELQAVQTSGGNLNVELGAEYTPTFWIVSLRGS